MNDFTPAQAVFQESTTTCLKAATLSSGTMAKSIPATSTPMPAMSGQEEKLKVLIV